MTKPLAPEVRSQFAQRLKEMRVHSGFLRARYFAKALGIEENRYTRYERAEVEPNLTLIHKMCEALRVSPNELLGFAETEGSAVSGFSENAPREEPLAEQPRTEQLNLLAWRLASETIAVRNKLRKSVNGANDPLATTREIGKLFQRLQRDPFGTVAEIAADEALQNLDSSRKSELAHLLKAYADGVAQGTSAHRSAEKKVAAGD